MSAEQAKLDALFKAAIAIESDEQRMVFVLQQCGDDAALREQLLQRLNSARQEAQPSRQPLTDLDATHLPDGQRAASLDAGLATTFGEEEAVVLGSAGHSVLKMLGQTIDVPRVALREADGEGEAPIERSASAEIPVSAADNRYRVDGEIARGGMGAILKGRDTDLGRDLAIKVLLDDHKDHPEVIQRFIEEAQIGGQLQHPGIAPVYELGQFADQRPFFSMKLVKGQTLSKLLAERKDPAEDRGKFLGILEQICQTLAYAHARGVIHRDLKPANIMVGTFGEVQVMDWGLAKVLAEGGVADEKKARQKHSDLSVIQTRRSTDSDVGSVGSVGSQTQMGSVMGTPAYMPPEQALGEIDQVDQRADVFGLGAILCEILTAKPPYVGDDGTAVFRLASRGKLKDCFLRLDECGADPELVQLAKQCLELELADRLRDASVVSKRLTEYLQSVETRLRAAELKQATESARADAEAAQATAERERANAEAGRAEEERKRRRTSLALAATILLLLALGGGGALYTAHQETNHQMAEATAQREHATEMRLLADERDRQRIAAENAKSAAESDRAKAIAAQKKERILRLLSASAQQPDPTLGLLMTTEALRRSKAEHPGLLFTTESAHRERLDECPGIALGHPTGEPRRWTLSPDKSRLITTESGDNTAWVYDLTADEPSVDPVVLRGHTRPIDYLYFALDGRRLITRSHYGEVRVWDLDALGAKSVLLKDTNNIAFAKMTPDGLWLVGTSEDSVRIWDMREDEPGAGRVLLRGSYSLKGSFGTELTTSPDRTKLIARVVNRGAGNRHEIWHWDLSLEDPAANKMGLESDALEVHFLRISPDGGRLLALVNKAGVLEYRLWDLTVAEPAKTVVAFRLPAAKWKQTWSTPDLTGLITIETTPKGDEVRLWNLTAEDPAESRLIHTVSSKSHWRTPAGTRLISADDDGALRILDLTSEDPGAESLVLDGHKSRVIGFRLHLDGKRLVTWSNDQTLRVWDLTSKDPSANVVVLPHPSPIGTVEITPDGRRLISRSDVIRVFDLDARDPAASSFVLRGLDRSAELRITADGTRLVGGGDPIAPASRLVGFAKTRPRIWNLTGDEVVTGVHLPQQIPLAITPDGTRLITCSAPSRSFCEWDLKSVDPANQRIRFRGVETPDFRTSVITPDGTRLITVDFLRSGPGTARIWDLTSRDPNTKSIELRGHPDQILSLAVTPDGNRLITGGGDAARIWDLTAKDPSQASIVLKGHGAKSLAITPNGRWLITFGSVRRGETARIWDLSKADPSQDPAIVREGYCSKISLTADGARLVTSAITYGKKPNTILKEQVLIWDLTADHPAKGIQRINTRHRAFTPTITPDGRWLITRWLPATLRIYDLAAEAPSAKEILLRGHTNSIHSLAVTPDGTRLITKSVDQTIRIWDLTTEDPGEASFVLTESYETWAEPLLITPDGQRLIAHGKDFSTRIWDLRQETLIREARVRSGRNFTQAEWQRIFPDEPYLKTFPELPGGE